MGEVTEYQVFECVVPNVESSNTKCPGEMQLPQPRGACDSRRHPLSGGPGACCAGAKKSQVSPSGTGVLAKPWHRSLARTTQTVGFHFQIQPRSLPSINSPRPSIPLNLDGRLLTSIPPISKSSGWDGGHLRVVYRWRPLLRRNVGCRSRNIFYISLPFLQFRFSLGFPSFWVFFIRLL